MYIENLEHIREDLHRLKLDRYGNVNEEVILPLEEVLDLVEFYENIDQINIDENFEFDGYDYLEIGMKFQILRNSYVSDYSEQLDTIKLKRFLWYHYDNDLVVEVVKDYIQAMLDCEIDLYETPIYEALLKIENNHTFMKIVTRLIGMMWT